MKLMIQKILGKPEGEWAIDVYKAVDMSLCGIFAFRSILNGNKKMEIPDFRKKEERDKYRFDNACTNPDVAGNALLPTSGYPEKPLTEEEAGANRQKWLDAHKDE